MAFLDDEDTHLSQLATDFVNPAAPRLPVDAPTDFKGAFAAAQQPPQPAANGAVAAAAGGGAAAGHAGPVPRSAERHGKLINDPIHGTFRLDPIVMDVVDSRHFQRLRRLKQLGLAYQVFPGASHNRFEHSLGVAHLAYSLGQRLWTFQRGELDIDRRDLRAVELAGACHDLGHGPFSHVFDRELLRRKGVTDWEHEEMSIRILEAIIDEKGIEGLREDDLKRVQRMILAGHEGAGAGGWGGQRWLSEIVANGRNSIDVDKFDYLMRDSMYCGVKVSCDVNRIMQFTKVIEDEICFKYSEYMNLHELFHSRATMHRQVYTHRKAKAIEFMVVDALTEADPVLRLTERIRDVSQFVQLDDSILELVENAGGPLSHLLHVEPEQEAALRAAQAVISRLRRRDLYKFCSDALVPQSLVDHDRWVMPTELEVVSCYQGAGGRVQLRPEDIILNEVKIDHSLGRANPLDHTSFFDDLHSTAKRKLRPEQISWMVPSYFQEKTVRVYSRNSSPAYVAAVHEAFAAWTKRAFGTSYTTGTPLKLPPRAPAAAAPDAALRARLDAARPGVPPGAGAAAVEAAVAALGPCAGAGTSGKRGRELFLQQGRDDTSPTNLLRTKQRRQVEGQGGAPGSS